MNVNLPELTRKLVASARAHPPSDRVPYAFEKRIMARLTEPVTLDSWALWSHALWRAAAPCVAIMLLLSAWSVFAPSHVPATDLSQEIENTLLAAVDADQPPADSIW
jgi:hypothetical protein